LAECLFSNVLDSVAQYTASWTDLNALGRASIIEFITGNASSAEPSTTSKTINAFIFYTGSFSYLLTNLAATAPPIECPTITNV